MHQRRLLPALLAALIVLGLIFMAGSSVQRSAWTEGYLTGLAASGQDGAIVPYALAQPRSPSILGGFALAFGLGLLLLVLVVPMVAAGKFLGLWAWRGAGRPGGEDWIPSWQRHRGAMCDWFGPWQSEAKPEAKREGSVEAEPVEEQPSDPTQTTK